MKKAKQVWNGKLSSFTITQGYQASVEDDKEKQRTGNSQLKNYNP